MSLYRATARGCRIVYHGTRATEVASSFQSSQRVFNSTEAVVPRVASTSIWKAIIPKAFRRPDDPVSIAERRRARQAKGPRSKEWNPATFFIAIALLIGSNAIQMIALRNSRRNFSRKAEAKIALLREVIEKVQKGEEVDVEAMLGTGNPHHETEWEEGMSMKAWLSCSIC